MEFTRRSLLVGAGSGAAMLLLTACTGPAPIPQPTPSGVAPTLRVPRPNRVLRSEWSADPLTLGATTFTRPGGVPALRSVGSEPVLNRVFFAGEAFSDAPGTLRGGARSGFDAATQVIAASSAGERVGIVGAGIAGARAAAALERAGYEVVVVEARGRVGGRIDSRVVDDQLLEFGAWRLDASTDGDLIRDLQQSEISVRPATPIGYRGAGDQWQEPDQVDAIRRAGREAIATALAWAETQPEDLDLVMALADSGAAKATPAVGGLPGETVLARQLVDLSTETGADPDNLSSWFPPYVATADDSDDSDDSDEALGDANILFADGPLASLVDDHLEGIDVLLSTAVIGVDYDSDGVSLRLSTGESLSVDRVVITVPVGVLKSDALTFDPPLPAASRAAVNALNVGDIEIVHVRFESAFWSDDSVLWKVVGSGLPITTWVNLKAMTGEPALMAVIGGSAAREAAALDDTGLMTLVRECLEPFVTA